MVIEAIDKIGGLVLRELPFDRRGWQLVFEKDEHLQSTECRTNQKPTHAEEDSKRVEVSQPGRAFWRRR